MAIFEDVLKGGNPITILAIGIGAYVIAPIVLPVVAAVAKPLLSAGIKAGYSAYQSAREAVSEVAEQVEDTVAEAKLELEQESGPVQVTRRAALRTPSRQTTRTRKRRKAG